jgi:glycerol-3-phosphate acyltransferase PlsY
LPILPTLPIILVVSYLLGSLPTAYIASRIRGIDLRTQGSGNLGATNAFRILGRRYGLSVLALDALKGGLAAWIPLYFFGAWAGLVGGFLAMLAHSYNPWFGFKATGKGAASGLGVIVVLVPKETILALAVFLLVVLVWRYVSLASMMAALTVLEACVLFHEPLPCLALGIVGSVFIFVRHTANIKRLLAGTEPKFNWKPHP